MSADDQFGNESKYIADSSVPGLSKFLRMLGVDCACDPSYTDPFVMHVARSENRIIITRSSKLLARLQSEGKKRKKIETQLQQARSANDEELIEDLEDELKILKPFVYYWVNSIGRENQILEVTNHFKIRYIPEMLFSRCGKCNGTVRYVTDKSEIKDKVHKATLDANDYFVECTVCGGVYYGNEQGNEFQKKFWQNARNFCNRLSYGEQQQQVYCNN